MCFLRADSFLPICSHVLSLTRLAGLNAYDSAAAATVKSVPAHSKGGVSAMVAHAHAPLMATGTKGQVVKVWTDECDVVSIRSAGMRVGSSSYNIRKKVIELPRLLMLIFCTQCGLADKHCPLCFCALTKHPVDLGVMCIGGRNPATV